MVEFKGRSEEIFAVTIAFLALSFTAVCLRCFVRLKLVRAFGWDDALMVFAMAVNILFALCGITGAVYGMGQHRASVDRANIDTALFWWWLGQTSYVFTCVIAKISIALALLRLTVAKRDALILWAVIAVSIIVGLVFWFMLTLQCQPVDYFWQRFEPHAEGHCMDVDRIISMAYAYSAQAIVCDFILALLPIVLVWNLQMNIRTKAALAGILAMGCLASAAVIVRIPYLPNYKDHDFLYATTDISIWSNVEAGLGITAGSLVTLRPLFKWFRDPSYRGTRSKKATNSMPLSSGNGNFTSRSQHNHQGTEFWRPDIDPDDSQAVVTTVQTERSASRTSSQADLNPKQHSPPGVNVHKTFLVTSDDV